MIKTKWYPYSKFNSYFSVSIFRDAVVLLASPMLKDGSRDSYVYPVSKISDYDKAELLSYIKNEEEREAKKSLDKIL